MRNAAAFVAAALLLGAAPAGLPDFAGKWHRPGVVQKHGKSLPGVVWTITVDANALTLVEATDEGTTVRTVSYNRNGSETFTPMKNPSDRVSHKLVAQSPGRIELLEVTPAPNGSSLRVSETWQLSADGRTLTMTRKVQTVTKSGPAPGHFRDIVYTFQRVQK